MEHAEPCGSACGMCAPLRSRTMALTPSALVLPSQVDGVRWIFRQWSSGVGGILGDDMVSTVIFVLAMFLLHTY